MFFRVASAAHIVFIGPPCSEILEFGIGKDLVLFFENESVSTCHLHVNHWRSWVWREISSLLMSASNGHFPSVLPDLSASVKWFPALVQVSRMAVLP